MVTATQQPVRAKDGLRPASQPADAARQPIAERIATTNNYAKIKRKLMRWVERINDALDGKRELGDSDVNDLIHDFASKGRMISRARACEIIQLVITELEYIGTPATDADAVKEIRNVTESVMKEFRITWVL